VRCRACAAAGTAVARVARRLALCAAPCRLAQQPGLLVSVFPSYLLSPAGDVVGAAYDVLFSQLLAF